MRSTLLFAFLFAFSSLIHETFGADPCQVSKAVTNSTFSQILTQFAQNSGFDTREKERRVEYLVTKYKSFGLQVSIHNSSKGNEGNTIVAKLNANVNSDKKPIYIVCGHYDTVKGTVGLFDNSAGAAAVLQTAQVLAKFFGPKSRANANVWFINWDNEEKGLEGSEGWISSLKETDEGKCILKRIQAVWDFDSVGSFSNQPNSQSIPPGLEKIMPDAVAEIQKDQLKGNFQAIITDNLSRSLYQGLDNAQKKCNTKVRMVPFVLPISGANACPQKNPNPLLQDFCRSDHASFWQQGIKAIHITDTAEYRNPCYHKPCDDWNQMKSENWEFLVAFTSTVAQAVWDAMIAKP